MKLHTMAIASALLIVSSPAVGSPTVQVGVSGAQAAVVGQEEDAGDVRRQMPNQDDPIFRRKPRGDIGTGGVKASDDDISYWLLLAFIHATTNTRLRYMADHIEVRHLSHADQVVERPAKAIYEFKIDLVDNQFVRAGTLTSLDLKFSTRGNVARIDFVPVERDEEDKVLRKLVGAGAYVFEYTHGHWQLTQELR